MKRFVLAACGVVATMLVAASLAIVPASAPAAQAATCVDSEGASTGFFCQPVSARGQPIPACGRSRARDVAACQAETVQDYCEDRGYAATVSYNLDGAGNLAEVVCSRAALQSAAEEWQPLYNVNLLGYDHREFGLARSDDWRTCKAACDEDGQCQAWTVSQGASTCYLKWDGNPELLNFDACCITGVKGMASAGAASGQKQIRTPEELRRLGSRVEGAAEDEVGRRAEDAIRRGIGGIFGN